MALAFVIVYCLGVMGVIIMSFAAIPTLFVLLLLISSSRILDQPKA